MSKCTTCHVNGEYVHDHPLYPVSKCSCACHKELAQPKLDKIKDAK